MDYGRSFRVLRAAIGWKAKDLAERAGYAASTIAHLEGRTARRRAPSKRSLADLTQALGATPRLVNLLAFEVAHVDATELGRELAAFLAKQPPLPAPVSWRNRRGHLRAHEHPDEEGTDHEG